MSDRHKRPEAGHRLAQVVSALFLIYVLICFIYTVLGFLQVGLLARALAGQQAAATEFLASRTMMHKLAVPQIAAYIIIVCGFLAWIYRAHHNLATLGIQDLDYSPAWAVGLFFFPMLNLVSPYLVVREIWKASSFAAGISNGSSWRSSASSPLIPFWWTAYILMGLLGLALLLMRSVKLTDPAAIYVLWLIPISYLVQIIAAVLAVLLVRKIDARQEEGFSRGGIEAVAPL